jgi:hypothetical protein
MAVFSTIIVTFTSYADGLANRIFSLTICILNVFQLSLIAFYACMIFAIKKVIDLVGERPYSPISIEKEDKENQIFHKQTKN